MAVTSLASFREAQDKEKNGTKEGEKLYFYYERYPLPRCYGPTEDEDREMREQMERDREAEKDTE